MLVLTRAFRHRNHKRQENLIRMRIKYISFAQTHRNAVAAFCKEHLRGRPYVALQWRAGAIQGNKDLSVCVARVKAYITCMQRLGLQVWGPVHWAFC